MEKHSVLEKDFLKEKEQEAISFQDRYKELQVNTCIKNLICKPFDEACNIISKNVQEKFPLWRNGNESD